MVTGELSGHERAMRGGIEGFRFAAPGENERRLAAAGLELVACEDTTVALAELARRWRAVRAARAREVRGVEGEAGFAGQQEFFAVTARAARERRLGRYLYLARRPAAPRTSATMPRIGNRE